MSGHFVPYYKPLCQNRLGDFDISPFRGDKTRFVYYIRVNFLLSFYIHTAKVNKFGG